MSFDNEHLTRQSDLVPMSILNTPITIIGAGAIGSWTTLALAKMGFSDLTVWDDDKVSLVNMSSQMFRMRDIGSHKTIALQNLINDFTGTVIKTLEARYDGSERYPGILIMAVDSMEARKTIWNAYKQRAVFTQAIIDPRMGAETAHLYTINPLDTKDCQDYEKSLYSDSQAVQEACTAKATIYTANMLSGLVCKAVKDLLTRPDYLRAAQWDIRENEFLGFKKKEPVVG